MSAAPLVLDTSGLLAALDRDQRHHAAAAAALQAAAGALVLSPFVLAELDYLVLTRVGAAAERALLDQVRDGVYDLALFGAEDLAAVVAVIERYEDLALGLADASLVVLAERYATDRLLTLDERHFRVVRTRDGRPFRLLPADAP